ncbi:MAG: hypothetical protein ACOC2M_02520 [bacterium]
MDLEQLQKELQGAKAQTLRTAVPANFKKDLPKDYINFEIDRLVSDALKKYDEVVVEDGHVVLKSHENLDSIKAADYFANNLKNVLGQPHERKNQPLNIIPGMSNSEKYQAIKSHVVGLGLESTSKEFSNMMKRLQVEHGLLK